MHVIATVNQKGGVGKSTLATALASAAHLDGRKTLIVDTDPQGSIGDWHYSRSNESKLCGIGFERYDQALTVPTLERLARGYGLVVIDTPPKIETVLRNTAVLSDLVIVPVAGGYFDGWALAQTLSCLDEADVYRESLGRRPVQRLVILNKANRKRVTKAVHEALSEECEHYRAEANVRERVDIADSLGMGETALTTAADGQAAEDILRLWRMVEARIQIPRAA